MYTNKSKPRKDLTGKRFDRLVVLGFDHMSDQHDSYWLCECDCGNRKVIRGANLKRGLTTSCGCKRHEKRIEDLTGRRFGRLFVIDYDHTDARSRSYWLCECDCGNRTVVEHHPLLRGATTSCGCKMREGRDPIDLTNRRFTNLYVIGLDHKNYKSGAYWLCECDCGNDVILRTQELLNGRTTSCGCMDNNPRSIPNTEYDSLYNVWINMKQRCDNKNNNAYYRYGGRGIYLCDEWRSFENFRDWAFKNGYEAGLTIDRKDNNDGYYPYNCRWVDRVIQANNRRSNHCVTYNGVTHTIAEWSRILDVSYTHLLRSVNEGDMTYFEDYYDTYLEE